MLSSTYEVTDMKVELQTYQVYDYANDAAFVTDLEYAISVAKRVSMIPVIGESYYSTLETLDKTGLSTTELYIYWAEVYYALAEFCFGHARKDKYQRRSANEGRGQGTVSYSNSGATGKEMMAYDFLSKADRSMAESGYTNIPVKITRRTSIYDS